MRTRRNRNRTTAIVVLTATLLALLAACAGQQQPSSLPGSLEITSSRSASNINYVLTGTVELPGEQAGTLRYSLNEGNWLDADLSNGETFTILLTLQEGDNKISLELTTAAGTSSSQDVVVTVTLGPGGGQPDMEAPHFIVSSATTSPTAKYQLTGAVLDNVAVGSASYTLTDGEPTELSLSAAGLFSVELLLSAGPNLITLNADDVAGNTSSAEFTVTYQPPIDGVTITPMVARGGEVVTITGTDFGDALGHISFGQANAAIEIWTDTEITVVVPPGSTGWLDVSIRRPDNEVTVEDFFAGIEVADSAELQALIGQAEYAGTALLLSGSMYLIGTAGTTPAAAFSFYGARTQGNPSTVLRLESDNVDFYSDPEFGIKLQDLQLDIRSLSFVPQDTPAPVSAPPRLPAGVTLENIDVVSSSPPPGGSQLSLGQISPGSHGIVLVALRMNDVTTADMSTATFLGREVHVQNSALRAAGQMEMAATDAPLLVSKTTIASGNGYLQLHGNGDSVLEGNTFAANRIDIGNSTGASTVRANDFTSDQLNLSSGSGGTMLIEVNQLELGNLAINTGGIQFSNNIVSAIDRLTVSARDLVSIIDNEFTFSNPASTAHAFHFSPNAGSLAIEFHGNQSAGANRLFRFARGGTAYRLTAELTGNDFTADLQAIGDVALLLNLDEPGAIATSGNVWGTLTTAQQVLDLIEYNNSTEGTMTVAEF